MTLDSNTGGFTIVFLKKHILGCAF